MQPVSESRLVLQQGAPAVSQIQVIIFVELSSKGYKGYMEGRVSSSYSTSSLGAGSVWVLIARSLSPSLSLSLSLSFALFLALCMLLQHTLTSITFAVLTSSSLCRPVEMPTALHLTTSSASEMLWLRSRHN
jgi:hypothetical protein